MTDPTHAPLAPTAPERASLPTDAAALPGLGPDYATILGQGLAALGVTLTPIAAAAIDAQARLLLAWNQHVNLTAIRTPEGVARLHVLDSLSAVPVLRGRVPSMPAVLDLGSGGGYPGLPLAVALPAGRLTLVDSVAKKTRFLGVVTDAARAAGCELAFEVLAARAEQLAADHHRESWDVVTARAVGTLAEVAELGLPLLRRGGLLVCWKRDGAAAGTDAATTSDLGRELHDAGPLLAELGSATPEVVPAETAGLPGHRLVLLHKVHPTPRRFPRIPAERRRLLLR